MIVGEMRCILGAGVLLDLRQSRRIRVTIVCKLFVRNENDTVVGHGST
jgi:hypothetical protein